MLLGQGLFGVTMALVASALAHVQAPKTQFGANLLAIKTFLQERQIPASLQHRVESFFRVRWAYSGGTDPDEPLSELPAALRESVCTDQCGWALRRFPLFANKGPAMLRQLCAAATVEIVPQYEAIAHRHDVDKALFFIVSGVAEIWSSDGHRIVCALPAGSYFGECAFFFGLPRLYTVRAATLCKVARLARRQVDCLFEPYPAWSQELQQLAGNTVHRMLLQKAFVQSETQARPAPVRSPESISQATAKPACLAGPGILHPLSAVAGKWEGMLLCLALASCLSIAYQAAFASEHMGLLVWHLAAEVPFWLDIAVKLHTAYFAETGALVAQASATRKHYAVAGALWLDMIAALPLELLGWALVAPGASVVPLVCRLRLNRLVRFVRVLAWFTHMERKSINRAARFQRLKFAVVFVCVVHWVACVVHLVACPETRGCRTVSWRSSHLNTELEPRQPYALALYFGVSVFSSVGYGDYVPVTLAERLLVSVIMLLGTLMIGYVVVCLLVHFRCDGIITNFCLPRYIVGSLAASIANADYARCRCREALDMTVNYLKVSLSLLFSHRLIIFL
jgi:hypothetical protein